MKRRIGHQSLAIDADALVLQFQTQDKLRLGKVACYASKKGAEGVMRMASARAEK